MRNALADKLWNLAGGALDEVFLLPPRVLGRFAGKRKASRETIEKEIRFLLDHGYVDRPETFFNLPERAPDHVRVSSEPYGDGLLEEYAFKSPYEVKNPHVKARYERHENNRTARLFRFTHNGRPRNTVLCLHGFLLGDRAKAQQMFKVERTYARGLDVALYVAPFHGVRSDGTFASQRLALRPEDPAFTCEFFGQAVTDLAACLLLLKELGAPRTGLIGASLGGYLSALYTCLASDH
ncbi:MAG: hypothetical protein JRI97_11860, partial [Deltaproteobacteria bacterium]|nr:hypothetical protein [Deltaproteobacteria bacterium]